MNNTMYQMADITGKRFGRLVAKEKVPGTKSKWLFQCDCGNSVALHYSRIKYGQLSCGCLGKECKHNFVQAHTKHGESRTKLYRKYKGMLHRCYDKTYRDFARYGGRGITVCDEWLTSYETFRTWAISTGYDESKNGYLEQSIDRIDNDKGYSPENCRWATAAEQQKNKENTVLYLYKGVQYTASEFADKFGISDKSFVYRRAKKGQSLEYILNDWISIHNVPNNFVDTIIYAKQHNIHPATVRRMIRIGKIKGKQLGRKWYVCL